MWGSERQSGVLNALRPSRKAPAQEPGALHVAFCEFCQKKRTRTGGIDPGAAGGRASASARIEKLVKGGPREGAAAWTATFTAFWRMLLNYSEAGSRGKKNSGWTAATSFQAALYRKVKIDQAKHADRLALCGTIFRSVPSRPRRRITRRWRPTPIFLRPAVYNRVAGAGRFLAFVRGAHSSVFGDLPESQILGMLSAEMGYGKDEAPYEKLNAIGLSRRLMSNARRVAPSMACRSVATQNLAGSRPSRGTAATPESCRRDGQGRAFKGGG